MTGSSETPDVRNLEILNRDAEPSLDLASVVRDLEEDEGLRFVLVTAEEQPPERIAAAIRESHGLHGNVEPIFGPVDIAADVNQMYRFFELSLPGVTRAALRESVYDVAYRLRNQTEGVRFERVEPDLLNADYMGELNVLETAFRAEQALCQVPGDCHPDHFWHLHAMRVPEAWKLDPGGGGARFGKGISIGHPDTGWTEHTELIGERALDTSRSRNFFEEGEPSGRDPLWKDALAALLAESIDDGGNLRSPGHGTGTGSVIVSRGRTDLRTPPAPGEDQLTGVAPGATLVPIRAIRHVFMQRSIPVAKAICHAADNDCHVISMSLGGRGTSALEAAVNYAVAKNVIVCAAAGNCVTIPGVAGFIAPGSYRNCIGVAGTNMEDRPWARGSRGWTVDISAPAEKVWKAELKEDSSSLSGVNCSQGTSFAVAGVAGIAALWLAYHGRDALCQRYNGHAYLHNVFYTLMQQTARRPDGWRDDLYGAGIIDAACLLQAELPDPGDLRLATAAERLQLTPQRELVAGVVVTATEDALDNALTSLLAPNVPSGAQSAESAIERWGPELMHILIEHLGAYKLFVDLVTSTSSNGEDGETEQARVELIREMLPWASAPLREVLHAAASSRTPQVQI
jgi:hypothetical protein